MHFLAQTAIMKPGDILITQGAGDIGGISLRLAQAKLEMDEVAL